MEIDRREMMVVTAASAAALAAPPPAAADASLVPAPVCEPLRYCDLPCNTRLAMARSWLGGGLAARQCLVSSVAERLERAFDAGAPHGYAFYREPGGRRDIDIRDEMLGGEPGLLRPFLRSMAAAAEDGYHYLSERLATPGHSIWQADAPPGWRAFLERDGKVTVYAPVEQIDGHEQISILTGGGRIYLPAGRFWAQNGWCDGMPVQILLPRHIQRHVLAQAEA